MDVCGSTRRLVLLDWDPRRSSFSYTLGRIWEDGRFDKPGRLGGARLPSSAAIEDALSDSKLASETVTVMNPAPMGSDVWLFEDGRKGRPAVPSRRSALEYGVLVSARGDHCVCGVLRLEWVSSLSRSTLDLRPGMGKENLGPRPILRAMKRAWTFGGLTLRQRATQQGAGARGLSRGTLSARCRSTEATLASNCESRGGRCACLAVSAFWGHVRAAVKRDPGVDRRVMAVTAR